MISDDPSWIEVILGDLKLSQIISSDLGKWRVIPFDLTISLQKSPKYFELHCKNLWIFSNMISEDLRLFSLISEVTSGDVKSCQSPVVSPKLTALSDDQKAWGDLSAELMVILGDLSADLSWSQVIWDNIGWSQVISSYPKYFELHCKNLCIFSVISEDLRWPQAMSSHLR